ncbi:MAG: TetR/AcrR family transcriptional regulator [Parvibaculum sp.]
MTPRNLKTTTDGTTNPSGQADARVTRGERTRQALIDAAFLEIHLNGYRAASLSDILSAANCTKGSLYHHFPDKHALGLAAVSEKVDAFIEANWLIPLATTNDPLTTIREIIQRHVAGEIMDDPRLGCPVQNISQEMSPLDEDFREYLNDVFNRWINAISDALTRGIKAGNVCNTVDPHGMAIVIVATHQGMVSLIKTAQNPEVGNKSAPSFFNLLETLRPKTLPPKNTRLTPDNDAPNKATS